MQVMPSEEFAEEILRDAGFSIVDEAYLGWAFQGFDTALREVVLECGLLDESKYIAARTYFFTRCIIPKLQKKYDEAYPDKSPPDDVAMKRIAEKVTDLIVYIYDKKSTDLYGVFEEFVYIISNEGWI